MGIYIRRLNNIGQSKADLFISLFPIAEKNLEPFSYCGDLFSDRCYLQNHVCVSANCRQGYKKLLSIIGECAEENGFEHIEISLPKTSYGIKKIIKEASNLSSIIGLSIGFICFDDALLRYGDLFAENNVYLSSYKPKQRPAKIEIKLNKFRSDDFIIRNSYACSASLPPGKEYCLDKSFSDKLINIINRTGKGNVEVYKDAWISKQVFHNAISGGIPKKDTIICLIISLKLDLDDALDLLSAAGYCLSPSLEFDAIIKEFIVKKEFDIYKINASLDSRGLPILGCKPRK